MARYADEDFFFTAPLMIFKADFRGQLVGVIEQLSKKVKATDPELMATINIDFFRG